jgi:hypothetical protein
MLSVPQTDVLTANTINTICCVYEVWTHLVILMRDNSFPLSHAIWGQCWNRTNSVSFADPPASTTKLTNCCSLLLVVHYRWTLQICEHCSPIRIRTQTSSSVVKGAIHYTIEPLLLPLSLSVVFPTFILSELMRINWFTISMSTPNLWWRTIIIPTTTSFRTNETIVTLGLFT